MTNKKLLGLTLMVIGVLPLSVAVVIQIFEPQIWNLWAVFGLCMTFILGVYFYTGTKQC